MKLWVSVTTALIAGLLAVSPVDVYAQAVDEFGFEVDPRGQNLLSYNASVGLTYSDNINRSESNADSDFIAAVSGGINFARSKRNFDVNVAATASYLEYIQNEFSSEIIGGLNGSAEFRFAGDRFIWHVEDTFGQAQVNLQQSNNPGNRQDVNRFATGPRLNYPLTNTLSFSAGATYTDVWYGDSDFDYDQLGGEIGLVHAPSRNRSLGFYATASETSYDNGILSGRDYDNRSVYARWRSRGVRTELQFEGGVNEIENETFDDSGTILGARLSRKLSSRTRASVFANRRFENNFASIQSVTEQLGIPLDETVRGPGTGLPFEGTTIGADVGYATPRTQFTLSVRSVEEETLDDVIELTRDRMIFSSGATYNLNAVSRISAQLAFQEDEFEQLNDKFDQIVFSVGYTRQLSRELSLNVYAQRQTGDANRLLFDYDENRIGALLRYTPRGLLGE